MSIIALITASLRAFLELSQDFKLLVSTIQRKNQIDYLILKSKALQDVKEAVTEEEYKKAAWKIHEATLGL